MVKERGQKNMPIKSITIDPIAKAVYLKIRHGTVKKTKELAQEVFLDFDAKNNLLGIELLNPGKGIIRKIAQKYHISILDKTASPIEKILQAA